MKHFNTILLSSALILTLSACGDNASTQTTVDNTQQSLSPQRTLIEGQTTLSHARICVDENSNSQCDESEVQTESSDEGAYSLELDYLLEDGSKILAEDGYNLVLEESNLQRFRFSCLYNKDENVHNINAITSLLESTSQNDKEALAEALHLDVQTLLEDPIALATSNDRLFLTERGIENGYKQQALSQNNIVASSSIKKAVQQDPYTTPTLEDSVSFLEDGTFLNFNVSEFLVRLELKIKDFFNDIRNGIGSQFGFEKLSSDVEREQLNGIWLVQEEERVDSCVSIDNEDKMITYKNDANESLSIYFAESTSTLSVLVGWQVVSELKVGYIDYDTLTVTNPKKDLNGSDYTFIRYNDLDSCKEQLIVEEVVEETVVSVPHLNALNGKFNIILPEGVTYQNLRVNYTNIYGSNPHFSVAEDGSFDFISAQEDDAILLLKGYDTTSTVNEDMVMPDRISLILEMNLYSDAYQGYKKTTIKKMINVYDMQDDGNMTSYNIGSVDVSLAEVNICVNNYDYEANGKLTYVSDLVYNEERADTNDISFFVESDNIEHFVALFTPETKEYALIRYMATEGSLDMRNSCVDLVQTQEKNVSISVEKEYDNNQSEILFSSLFGEELTPSTNSVNEEKTVRKESFNTDKVGYYYLKVLNHTEDKSYLIDKEFRVTIFGNDYTIKPEFISPDYAPLASIAIYNSNLAFIVGSDDKVVEIIELK